MNSDRVRDDLCTNTYDAQWNKVNYSALPLGVHEAGERDLDKYVARIGKEEFRRRGYSGQSAPVLIRDGDRETRILARTPTHPAHVKVGEIRINETLRLLLTDDDKKIIGRSVDFVPTSNVALAIEHLIRCPIPWHALISFVTAFGVMASALGLLNSLNVFQQTQVIAVACLGLPVFVLFLLMVSYVALLSER